MAIIQSHREGRFDPNAGNGRNSFEDHAGSMRIFHKSHASDLKTKAPRGDPFREDSERMTTFQQSHSCLLQFNTPTYDEPTLLESIRTCRVALTVSETGGSVTPIEAEDWLALVPVWKMALRRFSRN